ncbi:MAG TPA: tetratricopeptide repeat protein [Thermodesulfovibrionales bacterium]|jgi:tetratricopeptide (TPR) repeat protein|nr:tetratricopeptide repeat protein [Thermodesulfovibrionales bacterium]
MKEPEQPTNLDYKNYLIPVMIALVGLLSYSNSFTVPFQFDDDGYIVNNPAIKTFHYILAPADVATLTQGSPEAFPVSLRYAFMTRIIAYASFAMNYRLNGLNVVGYHLVNLLIHIVSAMLVFWIVKATSKTDYFGAVAGWNSTRLCGAIAAASALLFVSHPVQTQAVTYLTQRFASLAACLGLLALFLYIASRLSSSGHKRSVLYTTSLLSTVAAMLTKEFTVTLPFVIALYEITFFTGRIRNRLKILAPFAVTLAIIPSLVFIQQGSMTTLESTMRTITAANVSNITRTDYLLTQFRVIIFYLRLLFFPINQNVDHDVMIYHSLFTPPVFVSFVALLTLFFLGVFLYRASNREKAYPELRLASFGIIWFFITMSVESSIVPMGELAAEYRLYLPSVGVILATVSIGGVAARRISRPQTLRSLLLYGLCGVIVLMFSLATHARNKVWASEISLWEDAARKSPLRVRPHQNLGMYYAFEGYLEDAKRELMTALALEPNDPKLHNNLGMLYKKMKAYDQAVEEYSTVLRLAPGDAIVHYNLGNVYLEQGRVPEAVQEYQVTVRLIPDYDEAHNNLGIAYCQSGQFDAAIREYNLALRLNPQNVKARNNLTNCVKKAAASTNN